MPATPHSAVLVAAFGNAWLRDQAFGMRVIEALRERPLPAEVELADWSFGTVTAFQRLCERRWRRAVFISGTARGRPPGTLHRFAAPDRLPPPEEIHGRIADGVMGLVAVDNLVIMGRYYAALPDEVILIEAEPVDDTWGCELSAPVAPLVPVAVGLVIEEIRG